MRLRTFTATDMPAAMKMVRDALGDDAIILSTNAKSGTNHVTVTAAIEEDNLPPTRVNDSPPAVSTRLESNKPIQKNSAKHDWAAQPAKTNIARDEEPRIADDIKFELQNILRFHNLPEILVAKLLQRLTLADFHEVITKHNGPPDELYRPATEKLLSRNFVFEPLRFTTHATHIMLIGTPGIGKTMTVAKLATKLALGKHPLTVITTDTSRAGGIEQLSAFTSILNIELQVAESVKQLEEMTRFIPARTRVLIDTAGCSPYNHKEFAELKDLASIENIEPVLVMPAGGDSLEAIDMLEVFSEIKIRRLLVTRCDAARRFGGIMAAALTHGLSFCNISRSPSITDTLLAMEPGLMAQMLLRFKD